MLVKKNPITNHYCVFLCWRVLPVLAVDDNDADCAGGGAPYGFVCDE